MSQTFSHKLPPEIEDVKENCSGTHGRPLLYHIVCGQLASLRVAPRSGAECVQIISPMTEQLREAGLKASV